MIEASQLAACSPIAAAAALCALLIALRVGGDVESVLCATAITTYMVASSILLLHEEEVLGALLLAPAALASITVLVARDPTTGSVALWSIAASGAATVVAAGRHLGWPIIRRASISRADLAPAAQHFFHGVLCGLALSIILLLGTGAVELGSRAAAIAIPLLTRWDDGWRLRTFPAASRDWRSNFGIILTTSPGARWASSAAPRLLRRRAHRAAVAAALQLEAPTVPIAGSSPRVAGQAHMYVGRR
jgi:hypothetical protein